jgi:2-desacetyl-2-hydroxyethyl bacteriochlorophyllide A dehydrogenase
MPSWLTQILGTIYKYVPLSVRPAAKAAFLWFALRAESLWKRRSVSQGERIEFLDFEIAHLEPFELMGPGAQEVLCEARFSTVSPGTERAVLCGLPGARRPFPYTPGYSTAGVVKEAGTAVKGLKVGDPVAGRMPHASLGVLRPGTLFPVPAGASLQEASFLELGIICLQGIRKAAIRPGDRVAIVGMGLIGQMAARLARLAGADPLIAVANSRRRFGPAGAWVDELIALAEEPGAMGRVQADIVIEAVGSAKGIVQAMDAVRPGGTVVLLGSSRDLGRGLDWWRIAQERRVRLVGAHISDMPARDNAPLRWTYEDEGRLFLDLLASQRLTLADMITWDAAPDECNAVYEIVAEGGREHVGIVFDWSRRAGGGAAR